MKLFEYMRYEYNVYILFVEEVSFARVVMHILMHETTHLSPKPGAKLAPSSRPRRDERLPVPESDNMAYVASRSVFRSVLLDGLWHLE